MPLKKYFSAWNILFFGLGLFVLFFLLKQIDFRSLLQLVVQIKKEYLLLGGVVYLCKTGLRAFRFLRLNPSDPGAPGLPSPARRGAPRLAGFWRMLRLTMATGVASQVLPLKLGELSYVYLLKKDRGASISHGMSSLVAIRLIDLLAISLLFIVITFTVRLPGQLSIYFTSILAFVGVLLAFIVGLLVISAYERVNLRFVSRFRLVQKFPFLQRLARGADGFLHELKQYRGAQYLEWTALATVEWLVNYAVFHVLLVGIGLAPTFYDTVVSVTFAALASVLPINTFGSFGTQEAGWATGLVLMGYGRQAAIASGFATHLLILGYMLILGGAAWLSYYLGPTAVITEPQERSS